jgi:hypothetical protein
VGQESGACREQGIGFSEILQLSRCSSQAASPESSEPTTTRDISFGMPPRCCSFSNCSSTGLANRTVQCCEHNCCLGEVPTRHAVGEPR